MEKNTRILIGAILILFIAMVSFKFEAITGFVQKENWDSTAAFSIWPAELKNPGETVFGTVQTETTKIDRSNAAPLIYGTTSLDITRGLIVYEKANNRNLRRFTARLKCLSEDSRGKCIKAKIGGDYGINTGTLTAGKTYTIAVWEYPSTGTTLNNGKWVYGGEFSIASVTKLLPHDDKYDTGVISTSKYK